MVTAGAVVIGLYALVNGLRVLSEISLMIAVCCAASIRGRSSASANVV